MEEVKNINMLIDILNPNNYISINKAAIKIFGLTTAAYTSEVLTIYKKAITKKKLYNEIFFKLDRDYVTSQTGLSIEDQLKCDANLFKVNVMQKDPEDPDMISFNEETYASILSEQDIKLLNKISKKVNVANPKGTKQAQRDRHINQLKEAIECRTPEIKFALNDWIDAVMADPKKYLSVPQVKMFKNRLDEYCNGDLQKALDIIQIATVHAYIDCQWAINVLENNNKPRFISNQPVNQVRVTEQKRTTADQLGDEVF